VEIDSAVGGGGEALIFKVHGLFLMGGMVGILWGYLVVGG